MKKYIIKCIILMYLIYGCVTMIQLEINPYYWDVLAIQAYIITSLCSPIFVILLKLVDAYYETYNQNKTNKPLC